MNEAKCHKCTNKSIWKDYTNKEYCENHFLTLIEKRIRKNLRTNKLINPKKQYSIEENKEKKHLITKHFLKKIFSDRLKLTKNCQKITSETLDDEAEELLNYFMKKKEQKQKTIRPLNVITDEELKTTAKILKTSVNIKNKTHTSLTKEDPQLLFSINKSKDFVEKIKKIKKC